MRQGLEEGRQLGLQKGYEIGEAGPGARASITFSTAANP
jgi:hypothetical protein